MAELKIQVIADVQQAEKNLDNLAKTSVSTASAFSKVTTPAAALDKLLNKLGFDAQKAAAGMQSIKGASNSANLALVNTGRVIQDLPFGFLGIANNLNPLLESFQRLKAETGSTNLALKALGNSFLGAGGLGFALSLASSAAIVFGDRLFGSSKAAEQAKTAADKLKDSVNGIFSSTAKEATEVGSLVALLKNEAETRERKLRAIQELQRIEPDVFKNLKLEGDAIIGLDTAYRSYLDNLKTVIAVKIKQAQLEQAIELLLRKQGITLLNNEKLLFEGGKRLQNILTKGADVGNPFVEQMKNDQKELKKLQDQIDSLFNDIKDLSKGIKLPQLKEIKLKEGITIRAPKVDIDFLSSQIGPITLPKATINLLSPDFNIIGSVKRLSEELNKVLSPAEKAKIFGDLFKQLQKAASFSGILNISLDIADFEKQIGVVTGALGGITKQVAFTASTINDLLTPAFQNLFQAIIDGKAPLQAFFQSIGQSVQQLISKLIAAAVQALILSALFPGGVGGVKGFGSIFGKLLGFAEGGLVTGPTAALIGEGVGTSRSNPEVVTPLNKLLPMLQAVGGGGSGRIVIMSRTRGRDIVYSQRREQRAQRRLTG